MSVDSAVMMHVDNYALARQLEAQYPKRKFFILSYLEDDPKIASIAPCLSRETAQPFLSILERIV